MSDQNLDYVAIRRNIEKSVERQKRLYLMIFFWMHLIFFLVTMAANPKIEPLRTLNQAQAQWAAQNISFYRMVIVYKHKQYEQDAGICQEQVEVQNNSGSLGISGVAPSSGDLRADSLR